MALYNDTERWSVYSPVQSIEKSFHNVHSGGHDASLANEANDDGQSLQVVFIDVAKAFDHVDHDTLVAKPMEFRLIGRYNTFFLCHFFLATILYRLILRVGDVTRVYFGEEIGSFKF